ncbi:unnamed protein product [Sphenostylis stenocarpa]|uniref:Uncharacterized protein n=1 Tax=Sphenostylis stenocarpa TaxID=92480 RepID=A0AA86SRM9_9FABA|nr:unnamed protein product [Sphenostylis stenocarpa]
MKERCPIELAIGSYGQVIQRVLDFAFAVQFLLPTISSTISVHHLTRKRHLREIQFPHAPVA